MKSKKWGLDIMIIFLKIFIVLSYIFMITMNVLANSLPFYGRTTGEISNKYPTLFTPAGFTFSIWGVIYILLALLVFRVVNLPDSSFTDSTINPFVIATSVSFLLNGLWLVFWHRDNPWISTVVIISILLALIVAYLYIPKDQTLLRVAISVNLGWISVATIANITIALSATNINLLFSETVYFIALLVIGIGLVFMALYTQGDSVFALVFLWAYFGIFMRHLNENSQLLYLSSGTALLVLMTLIFVTLINQSFALYR